MLYILILPNIKELLNKNYSISNKLIDLNTLKDNTYAQNILFALSNLKNMKIKLRF